MDEDCDGFDEITNAGARQTVDEEFEAAGGSLPRINKTGLGSAVNGPKIHKLADERWDDHFDDPYVAREVLRRAKAGNPAAKLEFYRAYHKTLLDIASDPIYGGPPFEEKLSSLNVGFWKAFNGFNLGSDNGFYAYAKKFIKGAICDCITNWHYKGPKHETRAARKDRSSRPIHVQYNGVEGSHYDLEGSKPISAPIGGWIADDDHELLEFDGSGGKITDSDWDKIVAGRAVPTNWPPNEFGFQPCKPISRQRYEEDQARAYRFDTAAHAQSRLSQRLVNIGCNLGVPRSCAGRS